MEWLDFKVIYFWEEAIKYSAEFAPSVIFGIFSCLAGLLYDRKKDSLGVVASTLIFSVFISITPFVISKLFAFEPIVFVSLFISWIKKSNFLPIAIFSFSKFKNC